MTPDETPTKPQLLSLPDYKARLAAYHAVSQSEVGSLDGPISSWNSVCVIVDAYLAAVENERWRDMARNEAKPHCSDPDCGCRIL
jgi:hypothetical protein